MKRIIFILASLATLNSFASSEIKTFCGWVDNPTPANVWMEDKFGSITVSIQGGHQSDGDLFVSSTYFTNGNYGSGCGCMKAVVTTDAQGERIATKIVASRDLPLSRCAQDKALKSTYRPAKLIHSTGKAYTECLSSDELEAYIERPFEGSRICINEQNEYYFLAE